MKKEDKEKIESIYATINRLKNSTTGAIGGVVSQYSKEQQVTEFIKSYPDYDKIKTWLVLVRIGLFIVSLFFGKSELLNKINTILNFISGIKDYTKTETEIKEGVEFR